jgi:RNA polymerase sigma factor (TIGR02999 family)
MQDPTDFTLLLRASRDDADAGERLFALVYDELRGIARNQLRGERAGHTLGATALAHEVYLKLAGQQQVDWQNRAQFFAIAARATRRLLVDHARGRLRAKRGGGAHHTHLRTGIDAPAPEADDELVALDDALSRLKLEDPLKCRIVEMRYFGGFTHDEIAAALGVSTRTVERHWRYARAWLFRALRNEPPATATDGDVRVG